MGNNVETADCRDGQCNIISDNIKNSKGLGSDRIVYFSLIIVSVLCVIFAALYAHTKGRKRRTPAAYITEDDGN